MDNLKLLQSSAVVLPNEGKNKTKCESCSQNVYVANKVGLRKCDLVSTQIYTTY